MTEIDIIKNKFNVMPLPSYVNFYNVQDVSSSIVTPNGEGSLEFGDRMWGTYLDVDYANSSPKMVCFFTDKPSEHLELPKGNSRFRSDAFDLRRASDNPLTENQTNKIDWGKSNKVVGFNVDPTSQNQQIFKSFSVSQNPGKPTSESLEMLNQMANLNRNRAGASQSASLYNVYRNRSYKCE